MPICTFATKFGREFRKTDVNLTQLLNPLNDGYHCC